MKIYNNVKLLCMLFFSLGSMVGSGPSLAGKAVIVPNPDNFTQLYISPVFENGKFAECPVEGSSSVDSVLDKYPNSNMAKLITAIQEGVVTLEFDTILNKRSSGSYYYWQITAKSMDGYLIFKQKSDSLLKYADNNDYVPANQRIKSCRLTLGNQKQTSVTRELTAINKQKDNITNIAKIDLMIQQRHTVVSISELIKFNKFYFSPVFADGSFAECEVEGPKDDSWLHVQEKSVERGGKSNFQLMFYALNKSHSVYLFFSLLKEKRSAGAYYYWQITAWGYPDKAPPYMIFKQKSDSLLKSSKGDYIPYQEMKQVNILYSNNKVQKVLSSKMGSYVRVKTGNQVTEVNAQPKVTTQPKVHFDNVAANPAKTLLTKGLNSNVSATYDPTKTGFNLYLIGQDKSKKRRFIISNPDDTVAGFDQTPNQLQALARYLQGNDFAALVNGEGAYIAPYFTKKGTTTIIPNNKLSTISASNPADVWVAIFDANKKLKLAQKVSLVDAQGPAGKVNPAYYKPVDFPVAQRWLQVLTGSQWNANVMLPENSGAFKFGSKTT